MIITSNHTNPFGLLEKRSPILTDDELAKRAMLSQIDPEGLATADTNRQIESDARQASLASRIEAMVKLVEFTGEDKRIENSLWNFELSEFLTALYIVVSPCSQRQYHHSAPQKSIGYTLILCAQWMFL